MQADIFLADVAAVYAEGEGGKSFGSGRLIAPGLVLTAGHVVDLPSREAPLLTGWKVCLMGSGRGTAGGPPRIRRRWCGGAAASLIWRCCA